MSKSTESDVYKHLSQIVNSHKLAVLIVPLIEAMVITKKTGSSKKFDVSSMLASVIETGTDIYQRVLSENGDVKFIDTDAVPEKLLLVLSKSMRNNVVLYGNDSLGIVTDELIEAFNDNIEFIQRYETKKSSAAQDLTGRAPNQLTVVNAGDAAAIRNYAMSAMSTIFMPLITFHTNLYISNFIDEKELSRLNRDAMKYLTEMLNVVVERLSVSQGDNGLLFGYQNLALCSDIIATLVHDYHVKLIKSADILKQYVESPSSVLKLLEQPIFLNFLTMNESIKKAMERTVGES